MIIRKVLTLSLALFVAAAPLAAGQSKPADLTGLWTGTFTQSGGDAGGARIDLKHKGSEVSGTAGPDENRQAPISNGKVTTVKGVTGVRFDVTQPNGVVLSFDLTLTGGRLKGKATGSTPSGEKREAAVDVGRGK
jgi:hypothetical protein